MLISETISTEQFPGILRGGVTCIGTINNNIVKNANKLLVFVKKNRIIQAKHAQLAALYTCTSLGKIYTGCNHSILAHKWPKTVGLKC